MNDQLPKNKKINHLILIFSSLCVYASGYLYQRAHQILIKFNSKVFWKKNLQTDQALIGLVV